MQIQLKGQPLKNWKTRLGSGMTLYINLVAFPKELDEPLILGMFLNHWIKSGLIHIMNFIKMLLTLKEYWKLVNSIHRGTVRIITLIEEKIFMYQIQFSFSFSFFLKKKCNICIININKQTLIHSSIHYNWSQTFTLCMTDSSRKILFSLKTI